MPGLAYAAIKGDSVVYSGGKGFADIKNNKPFTDNTRMMIASISKTIIVISIMQLYEQGLLKLDDDVKRYLPFTFRNPWYPNDTITIKMLLTHTSTLSDYGYNTMYLWGKHDYPVPLMQFYRQLLTPEGQYYSKKQFFNVRPGSEYQYSNYGAALLACVIEHITATDYASYCNEHIFKPLSMNHSSFFYRDTPDEELAACYLPFDIAQQYSWPSYPDGHLMTTVSDMSKLLITCIQGGVFHGHRLLKAESMDLIFTNYLTNKYLKEQGLIFYSMKISNREIWGHGGGDEGISTEMFFDPLKKSGYIVFVNRSIANVTTIGTALLNYAERN
jgi:CubicO group peptidase (beta-lactamase class C family)